MQRKRNKHNAWITANDPNLVERVCDYTSYNNHYTNAIISIIHALWEC